VGGVGVAAGCGDGLGSGDRTALGGSDGTSDGWGAGLDAVVGMLAVGPTVGTSDGAGTAIGGVVATSDGVVVSCAIPPHALNSSNNTSANPRRTRN